MNKLKVIFEDNHLIAVNKEAGILVHGDETGDKSLEDYVKQYIKMRYNKPGDVYLGTLHRIDRPVSGAVVFARTSKAAERMSAMFANNEIEKTYFAITKDRPDEPSARLVHYMIKNKENNTSKAYESQKSGTKEAILDYELAGDINSNVLIKVKPLTGRPHQIRVQLKKIGCVINGDMKYGCDFANPDKSISLHCFQMKFLHPVKKEMVTITADVPDSRIWSDFSKLIDDL